MKTRIQNLIHAISEGMYEREEIISVALLAALCGQNTFLYGPPGTAKSLIARRVTCAFHAPAYFEYLMNRFSTPEEVFGPVSIKELKEDRYIRKTDAYLPKADFAFLDEIWKSSPAILNTLLTLINERIYKNGETIEKAPLKALLAASNETPDINQGLEALYDRFIIRLMVQPISERENFDRLVNSVPCSSKVDVAEELRIKSDEWSAWLEQIHSVELSPETLTIIHLIREQLEEQRDTLKVYVSDRRWQRSAMLMKASAFFNGRSKTNHSDALLLRHCLWTHEENRQNITDVVERAVMSSGIDSGFKLAAIDKTKEDLESEIKKELFHSEDVYKTEKINGKDFFKAQSRSPRYAEYDLGIIEVFIPCEKMKSGKSFLAMDKSGNQIDHCECTFDGQGTCNISYQNSHFSFTPQVLFHKGVKKENVNKRLVLELLKAIREIKADIQNSLDIVERRFSEMESELASSFVPAEKTNLAISGISEQIKNLKLRLKDCERLEALCQ
jgi:MoxR-like ATPase